MFQKTNYLLKYVTHIYNFSKNWDKNLFQQCLGTNTNYFHNENELITLIQLWKNKLVMK